MTWSDTTPGDHRADPTNGLAARARDARDRAIARTRQLQEEEGAWRFPLETDVSTTAIHLLACRYLGQADPELEREQVRYMLAEQAGNGGWSAYPGGPPVLDLTLLAYVALRAGGCAADDPRLRPSRQLVRSLGGAAASGWGTRGFLSAFGLFPRRGIPRVSPRLLGSELGLQKLEGYGLAGIVGGALSILSQPAGLRAGVVPVSAGEIMGNASGSSCRAPFFPVELGDSKNETGSAGLLDRCFRPAGYLDRARSDLDWARVWVMSGLSRHVDRAWRAPKHERRILDWLCSMQDCTGTFGGVFLTTIPPLMAFHAGGERYRDAVNRGVAGLRRWLVTDQRGTWTQFAASKVSDTVAATLSIGTHRSEASSRAIAWLLDRQRVALSTTGARRTARPGHGWNFDETAHRHPDCDTTSSVLRVLTPERERHADAFFGGLRWLLAMQNRDGGWPSWRRNQRKPPGRFLEAASAALVDPSEIDITCRVLIMLGDLEREEPAACKAIRPAIRKALRFLRRKQRPDGSWFGRFNVGFAYGTCEALEALACCGQPRDHQVARALEMLKAAQNPDGGWGESKACYRSNRFEHGASNPYTTGAVLAALLRWEAASEEIYGAGLHYLLSTQSEDGMWLDRDWHGVLVPGVSYFRYGFMATHKALLALDRYLERHQDSSAHGPPSRPS